jgi:hypothetical protein
VVRRGKVDSHRTLTLGLELLRSSASLLDPAGLLLLRGRCARLMGPRSAGFGDADPASGDDGGDASTTGAGFVFGDRLESPALDLKTKTRRHTNCPYIRELKNKRTFGWMQFDDWSLTWSLTWTCPRPPWPGYATSRG